MKASDFERFCKQHVLPQMSDWKAHREWLIHRCSDLVLTAVMFVPARHLRDEFSLHAVAMPLYAPRSQVGVPISRELHPPKESRLVVWELKLAKKQSVDRVSKAIIAVLANDAKPWLERRNSPAKILQELVTSPEFREDYKDSPAIATIAALSAGAAGRQTVALEIIAAFSNAWRGTELENDPVVVATRERLADWRKTVSKGHHHIWNRLKGVANEALRELKLESVVGEVSDS